MTDGDGPDRLLRIKQVEEITGLSRRTLYRYIDAGGFPEQFKPGGYASRWSEREVRAWVVAARELRCAA